MKKLICSTFREGYGIDQIRRTMTAGELINFLAQYDEDTPVYLSFDNGYTYGGITEGRFEEDYGEEDYPWPVSAWKAGALSTLLPRLHLLCS